VLVVGEGANLPLRPQVGKLPTASMVLPQPQRCSLSPVVLDRTAWFPFAAVQSTPSPSRDGACPVVRLSGVLGVLAHIDF
jgi:hypothetical protein